MTDLNRRHFLGLSTAILASISGCAGEKQDRIVNRYTEGYRRYRTGEETHPVAADAPDETQSDWFDRTAQLYSSAEGRFNSAKELCENDTAREICSEAVRKSNLMASMANQQAKGNTTRAISYDQQAGDYSVVHPDELRQAVSIIGSPGNVTVGPITPASLNGSSQGQSQPTDAPDTAKPESDSSNQASPSYLDGLSGSTLPDPSISGYRNRTYTQSFRNNRTEFSLRIPNAHYQYYSERPRIGDYGSYVSDRVDDSLIDTIASEFESYGQSNNHSDRLIVEHAIAWVQGLRYTQDRPAMGYNEYPKYPVETLVDRGGDCEDTSILLSSVLSSLGYDTVLLLMPDASHMAVGIAGDENVDGAYYTKNGTRYYYVETTGSGWRIGEVPQEIRSSGTLAQLKPVNSSPSLAFEWRSEAVPGGVSVTAEVMNLGDAPPQNAELLIDVQNQNKETVQRNRSSIPSISPESTQTSSIRTSVPSNRTVRLRPGILTDGTLHDVDTSGFHSP